ncbi:5305_t:CDS:2 [Dentiscutata erythropus]|uniref:5305_t:CDS:1 n=1 Tax=Dentiscutata erythropus TaxID=1348616 RepID=A0A9N9ET63_9GLOM|nr:5305_t:CDS:2 [Dentiscutata erythropus]
MQNKCASRNTTPLGKFSKFFKRLYRKKPKPTCQASGCSNLCAKKDKFCSANCESLFTSSPTLLNSENSAIKLNNDFQKTSTTSTPIITISPVQANPPTTSSFFTRILERKETTESELSGDDDDISSNGKKNKPKKSRKLMFLAPKATYSESSISSEASSDLNDSAYESTSLEEPLKKSKKKYTGKTIMTVLKSSDEDYKKVKKMFQVGLPKSTILGIFQLQMPTRLVDDHETYKVKIADSIKTTNDRVTHKMFHGTKHTDNCDPQRFIKTRNARFCKSGCGFCGIAQAGNQSKFSNYNGKMWFANNSITSLGYCGTYNVKTMFVVDVIAEKYEGILIVRDNAATIPKYLIIFK